MLIELDSVCIERSNTRILDSVSLQIPVGQHVAIIGPNGSGKSTLLKVLMKFFYPSVVHGEAGTVRILGREDWNVWELRLHLGFISSDIDHHFSLGRSARLTPLQSVLTGFSSSELEPPPNTITPEMIAEATRLLELFQIRADSRQSVGHMSTGERRRVLLARAMVFNPRAIILDEPTAGLDILARSKLLGELNVIAAQGTQIILVTHHLEEILPCIERTILLKSGQVFRDGSTQAGLTGEVISELFEAPIRVERTSSGYYRTFLS
jgi:iron complex transport system ATP-binding protein